MREADRHLDFAARMAEALLEPGQPVPTLITRAPGAVERRFGVYRNNVVHGLVDALEAVFPALLRVVGEEWFRAMAAVHVRKHPPRSRILFLYGGEMPAFLGQFEPAARMPYLPDLARLELAWLAAFHAADAAPLHAAAIAAVSEERLAHLRFVAHPATRLITSPYAIQSIFEANRGPDRAAARIDAGRPETCLVTRPRLSVIVTRLQRGQHALAAALLAGASLGEAMEAEIEAGRDPDLGATLGTLVAAGAFAGLHEGDRP